MKRKQITFRLPKDLIDWVKDRSVANYRSINREFLYSFAHGLEIDENEVLVDGTGMVLDASINIFIDEEYYQLLKKSAAKNRRTMNLEFMWRLLVLRSYEKAEEAELVVS